MGESFNAFLKSAKAQGMQPKALPLAKELFKMLGDVRTATVDECLDLLNAWLQITQMSEREDAKLLVSTIKAMKEDVQ